MIELPDDVRALVESESAGVYEAHPEYLWYDRAQYALTVCSWHNVEPDLEQQLADKVSELLFEQERFILFAHEYVVKIKDKIDVVLRFQDDRRYRELVDTISGYFDTQVKVQRVPEIPLARYKIPSKQQYSHLKNQLAKMQPTGEVRVDAVSLAKVTHFGNGIITYTTIKSIPFGYEE